MEVAAPRRPTAEPGEPFGLSDLTASGAVLTPNDSQVILFFEDDNRLRQLVLNSLLGPPFWVLSARTGDRSVLSMADEDQLSEAVAQGVAQTGHSYLLKPFDREYLLLKVQAALEGSKGPGDHP